MPPGSTLRRLSRGRWAGPNTASDGIWKTLKALSRLGLLFDAVHGFDKFRAAGRDRVLQDHNPYPVAFAPQDIRAIPDVLLNRRQQGTLLEGEEWELHRRPIVAKRRPETAA